MSAPSPRVSRSKQLFRNLCGTWNNPDQKDEKALRAFASKHCDYFICANETGDGGTPHLQFAGKLKKRYRWKALRELLPHGVHFEACKGSMAQNADYCKKGAQPKAEWDAMKTSGPNYGVDADFWEHGDPPKPGARSDIKALGASLLDGLTMVEMVDMHPAQCIKFFRGLESCEALLRRRERAEALRQQMLSVSLRPWQQAVVDQLLTLEEEADTRQIIWVYDQHGGAGKTFLTKYLCGLHDGQQVPCGRQMDMALLLDITRGLVIIDIPYAKKRADFPYGFMEKCRDGAVFSSKYNSGMKERTPNPPWFVIVFSNRLPDDTQMAYDRFHVMTLDENKELVEDDLAPVPLVRQEAVGNLIGLSRLREPPSVLELDLDLDWDNAFQPPAPEPSQASLGDDEKSN